MILDDVNKFQEIDPQNYLGLIDALPLQLSSGWELGHALALRLPTWEGISRTCILTLGGVTAASDLLAAYAATNCQVPVTIHEEELPAWSHGSETLVLALVHSNDPATIKVLNSAANRGCRMLVISDKPELRADVIQSGGICWDSENYAPARVNVGSFFSKILAAFFHLGLIPNPGKELHSAIQRMSDQKSTLTSSSPLRSNPAKRLAGQLMGRHVAIFCAGSMAPVARRWKNQINEVAKAWAQWESLPDACYSSAAGILEPENALEHTMALFLHAPNDPPHQTENLMQIRRTYLQAGIGTDTYMAQGESLLENLWTALYFGDYVSYYLALLYGVDPASDFSLFSITRV